MPPTRTWFNLLSQCRLDKLNNKSIMWRVGVLLVVVLSLGAEGFVPLIDGGKTMPKMYDAYFNDQIAKQASTAVSKAISDGKVT